MTISRELEAFYADIFGISTGLEDFHITGDITLSKSVILDAAAPWRLKPAERILGGLQRQAKIPKPRRKPHDTLPDRHRHWLRKMPCIQDLPAQGRDWQRASGQRQQACRSSFDAEEKVIF